jgi:D-alanyl-lipoteichoic acid acyltransferase DltB (MBOAT superfamily)
VLFNSLVFVAFLAVCLVLYASPLSWRVRKGVLLVASYLFYAAWNPPFVALLAVSTLVDWHLAKRMPAAPAGRRRALLITSLIVNLGLLGYFKYGGFLLENFQRLVAAAGIDYRPPDWDIVLPVGISFYTFQTLSYTLDVYRGRLEPWKSSLDFGLFVSFFPQLVAGPIVRAADFLPQCTEPRRVSADQLGWGTALLTLGLFEKVILADTFLAPVADRVYGLVEHARFTDAWVGTLAFSGQIFFDFAGYSTCAVGVATLFGFVIPRNFLFPYAAIGFSDFWRRWHVSLSSWLRDYLYVPLGGNRRGGARTLLNLMLTMLLGGLWHGAAWRFVVWGGLHGLYLVGERGLGRLAGSAAWLERRRSRILLALTTYLLVCFAWVFFRAADFASALEICGAMLGGGADGPSVLLRGSTRLVLALTVATLGVHWWMRERTLEELATGLPSWAKAASIGLMWTCLALAPGDERAFIYFQF